MQTEYAQIVRAIVDGPEKNKPSIHFSWMFDWAHNLNEAILPLTERDQLTFMKKFLENWRSFNRGPAGAHIFRDITESRRKQFLSIVGESLNLYHGMRLMFTLAHLKEGKAEMRCWYGIPLDFSIHGVDSDRKGLLFTIKGEDGDVQRYLDSLLTEEEKESRMAVGNLRTFIFGFIVGRKCFDDRLRFKPLE